MIERHSTIHKDAEYDEMIMIWYDKNTDHILCFTHDMIMYKTQNVMKLWNDEDDPQKNT